MNDRQLQTVERVREFLEGSEAVEFRGSNGSREILLDRGGANKVQVSSSKERGERSDTPVYRQGYGILPVTGIQADSGAQTDRAVEENAIQETPLSPEVYPIRSRVIGQDR